MNIDFLQKQTVPINDLQGKLYQMFYANNDKILFYGDFFQGACMYDLSAKKIIWQKIIKRKNSYEGLMISNPTVVGNDIICVYYDRYEQDNPKGHKFIVRLNIDTGEEVWRADTPTNEEFLVHENKVYAFGGRSVLCFDLNKQDKNTIWKRALSFKAPEVFKECTASDAKGQPSEKYLKKKTMANFKYFIWNKNLVVTTDLNRWAVIETAKGTIIREIDLTTAQVIKDVMTYPLGEIITSGDYAVFMHHGVFVRVNLAEGTTDATIPTYKNKRKDAPDEPHTFWSYYDHGGFHYNGRFFTNNATTDKNKTQEIYELPINTADGKIENTFQFPFPFKGGNVMQAGSLLWTGFYGDSQKQYPGATFYSLEDGENISYLPESGSMVMNIACFDNRIMILESKNNKMELHLVPYEQPVPKQPAITLTGAAVIIVQPQAQVDILTDRYEYLNAKGEKIETYKNSPINTEGKTPQNLELQASILLTKNDGSRLYYLGGNLVGVVGGIPAYMDVIDISTGKVIWIMDQCEDKDGMVAYDDDAVYMGRTTFGNYFLTAHNKITGDTIWHCPLSGNPKQFSSVLIVGEKYLLHSNGKKTIVVDKKTGKKIDKLNVGDSDIMLLGMLNLPASSYLILDNIIYYVHEGILYAMDMVANKMLFNHDFIKSHYLEGISNFDLAKDKSSFKICIVGRNLNSKKDPVRFYLVNYDCINNTMTCTEKKGADSPLSVKYKNDILYLCNPDNITVVKSTDFENPISSLNLLDLKYESYDKGCIFAGDTIISFQEGEYAYTEQKRFNNQSILNIIKEKQ